MAVPQRPTANRPQLVYRPFPNREDLVDLSDSSIDLRGPFAAF